MFGCGGKPEHIVKQELPLLSEKEKITMAQQLTMGGDPKASTAFFAVSLQSTCVVYHLAKRWIKPDDY